MKKLFSMAFIATVMCSIGVSTMSAEEPPVSQSAVTPHIIPQPVSITPLSGEWSLTPNTYVVAQSDSVVNLANYLCDKLRTSTGFGIPIVSQTRQNPHAIRLEIVSSKEISHPEGYHLNITTGAGVQIQAATIRGLFYGMQSLLQILPPDIESQHVVTRTWHTSCYDINDYPRFKYRGMMFDVCRHFLPIEKLKQYVDILAMLKINVFHWHLTEDQGWRIEIKKYPKLTEIGSKRIEGDGSTYGPFFYTQEQVKDFVAYATARQVEVIPEIEMPGHSLAALAAYPELGCKGKGYKVRNIWGVSNDVYCAGNEKVFDFLADVIAEVAPLFPSKYFHIGGDECPKDSWKKCPKCQKRIKDNHLKNEYELQSYFVHRAEQILAKHGKRLIGWDEILEGGLAPTATVMSWTGEKGGIKAANMGHDVIMTPSSHGLYLDHYQGDPKVEPQAICCFAPLKRIYSYDPIPSAIEASKRHHILGAQANLWTEYIPTPSYFEYMFLPRIAALAELDWTPLADKNYDRFLSSLPNFEARLDQYGINYYIPQPEQPNGSLNSVAFKDHVRQTFTTQYPTRMVYTIDGTEPTAESLTYTQPLDFDQTTTLKIRSIAPTGKMSPTRTIHLVKMTPMPAASVDTTQMSHGLNYKLVPQQFTTSDGLFSYIKNHPEEVQLGHVTKLDQIKQPLYKGDGDINYYGGVYEGYIYIPTEDVYVFSSLFHKVWLDGKLIINNEGELQHHARHDVSFLLAPGLHQIKFTNIAQITCGFPTQWNDAVIYIKRYGEPRFQKVGMNDYFSKTISIPTVSNK